MKVDGVLFKPFCVIVIDKDNDEPVFGEICSVFCTDSRIVFQIRVKEYCHHLHCFVVSFQRRCEQYLVSHDRLMDVYPYGFYSSQDPKICKHIVLRSIVM